jgi:hypothetical protein
LRIERPATQRGNKKIKERRIYFLFRLRQIHSQEGNNMKLNRDESQTALRWMIRERPILMSTPMVKAILDGRKTMTRRVMKLHSLSGKLYLRIKQVFPTGWRYIPIDNKIIKHCPHGIPGDRLWVRETFYAESKDTIYYKASWTGYEDAPNSGWKPSIFMPRWASRITLEITNVRVERLQEITEENAKAEGTVNEFFASDRYWFKDLWDSINGKKYPWSSNPWCWVIEFKRKP